MELDWGTIIRNLKDEASAEDRERLSLWLTDSENKNYYAKLKQIWDRTGKLQESYKPDLNAAWSNIDAKLDNKRYEKSPFFEGYSWIATVAAALLILIAATFVVYQISGTNGIFPSNIQVFETENDTDSLLLSDGTRVWLNKNSSIKYQKKFGKERTIRLSGEAYFEVAKDTEHPFVVVTEKTTTRVLGTSFNINTKDEQPHITVFSGKVAFSDALSKETIILVKGERAEIVEGRPYKYMHNDPNILAWKTGLVVFENTPMDQVAATLSNFYQTKIQLSDQISELNLTASFYRQDVQEALEVISITLDLNIEKNDVGFILKP